MKKYLAGLLFILLAATVFPEDPGWLFGIWNVRSIYQIKEDLTLGLQKPDKPYAFEFLSDRKAYIQTDGERTGKAFAWEYQDGLLTIDQGGRKSIEQLDLIENDLLMMFEQNPKSSKTIMLIMAREKKK